MTRKQALQAIAKKILQNVVMDYYSDSDNAKGIDIIINGTIGLREDTNTELEEKYFDLFNKQITIKR